MRHLTLATILGFLLAISAFAQDPTPTRPNRTDPNPPMPGAGQQTSPSQTPSQSPDMSGSSNPQAGNESRGEKKLKGCIQSQGGSYALQDKHGKTIALTGSSDLASHVGHTVAVHGRFSSGSDSAAGSSVSASGGASATGAEQFVVSKIDMVSDSCKMDKNGHDKDHDNKSDQTNPK
jgi:hypothetical protein